MTTTTVKDSIAYGGDYFAQAYGPLHIKDVLEDAEEDEIVTMCGITLEERAEVIPSLEDDVCAACTAEAQRWTKLNNSIPRR